MNFNQRGAFKKNALFRRETEIKLYAERFLMKLKKKVILIEEFPF
jgi:hypothetical protein